jgi:hypothetical protein
MASRHTDCSAARAFLRRADALIRIPDPSAELEVARAAIRDALACGDVADVLHLVDLARIQLGDCTASIAISTEPELGLQSLAAAAVALHRTLAVVDEELARYSPPRRTAA